MMVGTYIFVAIVGVFFFYLIFGSQMNKTEFEEDEKKPFMKQRVHSTGGGFHTIKYEERGKTLFWNILIYAVAIPLLILWLVTR